MEGQFIAGICLAILGALCINVGKAVQKQHVHVFLLGRDALEPSHRRHLFGWFTGLGLTLSSMAPFSLALKLTESPSIVSSMTGVGLVGLAIYAVLVIGERFERTDLVGVVLVVAGTTVLSYVSADTEIAGRQVLGWGMLRSIGPILLVCALACAVSFKVRRIWGLAWGLTSGTCLGAALILGDVALMEAGGSILGQLRNPYPYIALLVSVPALLATQIGFLRARALEVVPAVNSSVILAPLLLEHLMYGYVPSPFKLAFVGVIVAGVVLLSMGTGAMASKAPAEEVQPVMVTPEGGEDALSQSA